MKGRTTVTDWHTTAPASGESLLGGAGASSSTAARGERARPRPTAVARHHAQTPGESVAPPWGTPDRSENHATGSHDARHWDTRDRIGGHPTDTHGRIVTRPTAPCPGGGNAPQSATGSEDEKRHGTRGNRKRPAGGGPGMSSRATPHPGPGARRDLGSTQDRPGTRTDRALGRMSQAAGEPAPTAKDRPPTSRGVRGGEAAYDAPEATNQHQSA